MFSHKSLWALAACAVVMLAAAGCSDSDSAPSVVDLAPPAVPTDLGAVYTNDVVKVSWAPNVEDADFAGFKLSRIFGGSELQLINTPTNLTQYIDGDASTTGLYQYRVTAVDHSGNESAYASVAVEVNPSEPRHPDLD
jgi:hypothetical protein